MTAQQEPTTIGDPEPKGASPLLRGIPGSTGDLEMDVDVPAPKKMKRPKSEADVNRVRFVVKDEGEKTGRWTDEEHTRFLHGLELFGKKWTKVADIVGTRTTVQVRSHAQKYFQKLDKDRTPNGGSSHHGSGGSGGDEKRGLTSVASAPSVTHQKPAHTNHLKTKAASQRRSGDDKESASNAQHRVPTALRRFLPKRVVSSGRAGAAELAAGIFKFLTPLAVQSDVPSWYETGGTLKDLLTDAEGLDWRDDDGGSPLAENTHSNGGLGDRANANSAATLSALPQQKPPPKKKKKKSSPNKKQKDAQKSAASSSNKSDVNVSSSNEASISRNSSFDALCSATLAVEGLTVDGRKRALSNESLVNFDADGLFYDDDDNPLISLDHDEPDQFIQDSS